MKLIFKPSFQSPLPETGTKQAKQIRKGRNLEPWNLVHNQWSLLQDHCIWQSLANYLWFDISKRMYLIHLFNFIAMRN